jgi:ribosomal-protein-alanine N-acetyltransferase
MLIETPIETPRLWLVQTPLDVIQTRLAQNGEGRSFRAEVAVAAISSLTVTFPSSWPGDALALFPALAAQHYADPNTERWEGTLVERSSATAIGQLGCKGPPDARGDVEIGYGLNPEARGQGYASEMVGAFCDWLLQQSTVVRVTALTRPDNRASVRVLERSGFNRVGEEVDETGRFLFWRRSR